MAVVLETSFGDLVIDLYTKQCPKATKNFLKLCKIKYFNNCLFFNIQKDYIVQTGDPTNTGSGGESIYGQLYGEQAKFFEDEIHPSIKFNKKGLVAMALKKSNQNASQFFITVTPDKLTQLDGKHTIFGEVGEGLEVLDKINDVYTDAEGKPKQIVRIKHSIVLEDPFEDPKGLDALIPDRSPIPPREQWSDLLDEDEVEKIGGADERPAEEIEEEMRVKEAKSRAGVLEIIGDLPDADVKPPDNVLFVCKLNPVTTSEDLELIFSRFGEIKSCEVVKDWKTGDSLQYAFIEFVNPEDCEEAYFKMDNVLIDDRRIHIDFSQSVSKLVKGKDGRTVRMLNEYGHTHNKGFVGKGGGPTNVKVKQMGKSSGNYNMVFDEDDSKGSSDRKRRDRSRSPAREKKRQSDDNRDKGRDRDRDRDRSRNSYSSRDSRDSRDRRRD